MLASLNLSARTYFRDLKLTLQDLVLQTRNSTINTMSHQLTQLILRDNLSLRVKLSMTIRLEGWRTCWSLKSWTWRRYSPNLMGPTTVRFHRCARSSTAPRASHRMRPTTWIPLQHSLCWRRVRRGTLQLKRNFVTSPKEESSLTRSLRKSPLINHLETRHRDSRSITSRLTPLMEGLRLRDRSRSLCFFNSNLLHRCSFKTPRFSVWLKVIVSNKSLQSSQ